MPAETAVELLSRLDDAGVEACVGGGWAVDALLAEQTREHADLDLWLPGDQLEALSRSLAGVGVDRLYPWPGDRPWNFVLHDGGARRVDLHLYERLPGRVVHYGGVDGERFPAAALDGRGTIAGRPVRCEQAEWSLRCHSGYPPRDTDRQDVERLCRRFGLTPPQNYRAGT